MVHLCAFLSVVASLQENFVVKNVIADTLEALKSEDPDIALCDFGTCLSSEALEAQAGRQTMTRRARENTPGVGSKAYMAPEVRANRANPRQGLQYDEKADMWSLGVCFYVFCGNDLLPFGADGPLPPSFDPEAIVRRAVKRLDENDSEVDRLINVMIRFLQPTPSNRADLKEAMQILGASDEQLQLLTELLQPLPASASEEPASAPAQGGGGHSSFSSAPAASSAPGSHAGKSDVRLHAPTSIRAQQLPQPSLSQSRNVVAAGRASASSDTSVGELLSGGRGGAPAAAAAAAAVPGGGRGRRPPPVPERARDRGSSSAAGAGGGGEAPAAGVPSGGSSGDNRVKRTYTVGGVTTNVYFALGGEDFPGTRVPLPNGGFKAFLQSKRALEEKVREVDAIRAAHGPAAALDALRNQFAERIL
uniref:Protein kinase domain-containing protein n=1 Tax=Chromera velia CCMP2878 TaxID=1169474 RepID=A0A0G4GLQ6_9ALVE|eukprot:Cvel_22456.t1-p1 / transcript=Cvel_22456.t1 / gene=Cvel_22456 / organism=Chromera_velia_CCMP2878 / gene_product=hypothetical protein / transcript_product=hypothetical protein / location=Cvel_scaffold2208:15843-18405(-) / protein_length=419 / sequence_SO=supercontig / SO=protein_coding / is_pseudo=false